MPFDHPIIPFICQRGNHRRAVALDPRSQALHFRNPTLRRSFHPTRKSCLVSLLKDAVEFSRQNLRLGNYRRYLYQMFYEGALFSFQFLGVSK